MDQGVHVSARDCGVYGETYHPSAPTQVLGVGVYGRGGNYGVFGETWNTIPAGGAATLHRRLAGVIGRHGNGGIGTIGVAGPSGPAGEIQNGIGVVGASLSRGVGNPLEVFQNLDLPGSGPGIGVLGISDIGQGVRGESTDAEGGSFTSEQGVGVRGSSNADRGGVFRSRANVAQIRLVPLEQSTPDPELPQDGQLGDLLMIRNIGPSGDPGEELGGGLVGDSASCTLWICTGHTRPELAISAAIWQQVRLDAPVTGTL
jgi:hypothetical protein